MTRSSCGVISEELAKEGSSEQRPEWEEGTDHSTNRVLRPEEGDPLADAVAVTMMEGIKLKKWPPSILSRQLYKTWILGKTLPPAHSAMRGLQ